MKLSWPQKTTYHMIPFTRNIYKRKIYRQKVKWLLTIRTWKTWGDREREQEFSGMMKMF